jgi:hypothetical protein
MALSSEKVNLTIIVIGSKTGDNWRLRRFFRTTKKCRNNYTNILTVSSAACLHVALSWQYHSFIMKRNPMFLLLAYLFILAEPEASPPGHPQGRRGPSFWLSMLTDNKNQMSLTYISLRAGSLAFMYSFQRLISTKQHARTISCHRQDC